MNLPSQNYRAGSIPRSLGMLGECHTLFVKTHRQDV
jgi:hypothetical protein